MCFQFSDKNKLASYKTSPTSCNKATHHNICDFLSHCILGWKYFCCRKDCLLIAGSVANKSFLWQDLILNKTRDFCLFVILVWLWQGSSGYFFNSNYKCSSIYLNSSSSFQSLGFIINGKQTIFCASIYRWPEATTGFIQDFFRIFFLSGLNMTRFLSQRF